MEALQVLVNHIPMWQGRMDGLNKKIGERQQELAAWQLKAPSALVSRSLKNEVPSENEAEREPGRLAAPMVLHPSKDSSPNASGVGRKPHLLGDRIPSENPDAIPQTNDETADYTIDTASQPTISKSKPCTHVYYDSFVQIFFDDLVRFISSCRNDMRKAKMDAKVAEIKRMAEIDMGGDPAFDELPVLRYMTARRFHAPSEGPRFNDPRDIFNIIDGHLEAIQDVCENGAHRFLRDGRCGDELTRIESRMRQLLEAAKDEQERLRKAKFMDEKGTEPPQPLTRRFISMRKDIASEKRDPDEPPRPTLQQVIAASKPKPHEHMLTVPHLEIDPNYKPLDEADMPPILYRKTRDMRPGFMEEPTP